MKALSVCLFAVLAIAGSLQARNPWLEPFHENSIWNHPIGSGAQLVHAGLTAQPNLDVDKEIHLQVGASDPIVDIYVPGSWEDRWPGSYAAWQGKMRLPSSFTIADAAPPQTPNNPSAFLMPDKATLVQLAPLARVTAGAHVVGYRYKNVFLYGMGEAGSHSGSELSGFGGSIRSHEWGSDKTITHALKLNVQASKFLSYNSTNKGYRWPATTADGYANGHYKGTKSATRMGALLTFQPSATHSSIGGLSTWQGRKIFDAIYKYGIYIVEDTYWNAYALNAERSVNIPIGDANFRADINKIVQHLHVVNNNSATNIGGGGTLRAPKKTSLGAPIGAQITLRANANTQFVTAGPTGWNNLLASRTGARVAETFQVVDAGGGYIALRSIVNNRYVTVSSNADILVANVQNHSTWEHFTWHYHDNGKSIALKARKNGKFVTAENAGAGALRANRTSVGGWEKFTPGGGAGAWTEHGSSTYFGVPGF